MDSELQMYEFQLSQVNDALGADPDNAELKTLKDELTNLISLTKSLAAEQSTYSSSHARTSGSAAPSGDQVAAKPNATGESPSPQTALKAGDECVAKYAADGRWYPARITSVAGSGADPVYHIIFKGYNNTEMVRSADIKASAKSHDQSRQAPGTSSTAAEVASTAQGKKRASDVPNGSPLDADTDRDRKKKRAEKRQERTQSQAQLASEKANSWQKFAKKGQKKGYGIAGKNSMFKTPDDPLAKVGVVGAGRGMTQYSTRTKHVYES